MNYKELRLVMKDAAREVATMGPWLKPLSQWSAEEILWQKTVDFLEDTSSVVSGLDQTAAVRRARRDIAKVAKGLKRKHIENVRRRFGEVTARQLIKNIGR